MRHDWFCTASCCNGEDLEAAPRSTDVNTPGPARWRHEAQALLDQSGVPASFLDDEDRDAVVGLVAQLLNPRERDTLLCAYRVQNPETGEPLWDLR
jgi:hypothetical protein